MRIAVPKEHDPDERRVALVPEVVRKLSGRGIELAVERGAGERALISDAAFEEAGAVIVDGAEVWKSDVVITIAPPKPEQIASMSEGSLLIGFLAPLTSAPTATAARDAKVTAFAM
ncbi:MAG: NAD(P)(+) transhydrogenase (Re/Si-specific) subunit alpha, partial [Solirubrobacterales bacterium]|nr:NAD(P)(+) transhydrogenase (Re/Si-specific) subunit alpha [Solirubrobacterales bacterium]